MIVKNVYTKHVLIFFVFLRDWDELKVEVLYIYNIYKYTR